MQLFGWLARRSCPRACLLQNMQTISQQVGGLPHGGESVLGSTGDAQPAKVPKLRDMLLLSRDLGLLSNNALF